MDLVLQDKFCAFSWNFGKLTFEQLPLKIPLHHTGVYGNPEGKMDKKDYYRISLFPFISPSLATPAFAQEEKASHFRP